MPNGLEAGDREDAVEEHPTFLCCSRIGFMSTSVALVFAACSG